MEGSIGHRGGKLLVMGKWGSGRVIVLCHFVVKFVYKENEPLLRV